MRNIYFSKCNFHLQVTIKNALKMRRSFLIILNNSKLNTAENRKLFYIRLQSRSTAPRYKMHKKLLLNLRINLSLLKKRNKYISSIDIFYN